MEDLIADWNTQSGLEHIISISSIDTPLGIMWAGTTAEGILFVEFDDRIHLEKELHKLGKLFQAKYVVDENHSHLKQLKEELTSYFNQSLTEFTVPLLLTGTDFQKKVYRSLQEIPYGKTVTYKEQAIKSGDVKAIRAVATANGMNKHAIVIPCHRIIGSDGSLVGYAGGLWRKKALLQLENALHQNQLTLL
ncbi:MAG TPA: methylated-DNA--[protein]-cysteine S-methyltransferase [Flavobacterium sp.]|nr:methylated-DNA--[protein]-cysteine S-methyltransferase [Flavobacterium sp.]